MKLLQQLNEQADEYQDAADLVRAVREAKPFFEKRQGTNKLLYRGVRGNRDLDITYASPRPDRVPSDTHPIIHKAVDQLMVKDHGHPYRTNSLFTTGSPGFARFYGELKIVLPIGDFSYLWSNNVRDAYTYFDPSKMHSYMVDRAQGSDLKDVLYDYHLVFNSSTSPGDNSGKGFLEDALQTDEGEQLFNHWIAMKYDHADYLDSNLNNALDSGHEILLNCRRVALVDPRPLNKWSRKVLEQQFDLGDLSDKDLQKADLINLLSTVV